MDVLHETRLKANKQIKMDFMLVIYKRPIALTRENFGNLK